MSTPSYRSENLEPIPADFKDVPYGEEPEGYRDESEAL